MGAELNGCVLQALIEVLKDNGEYVMTDAAVDNLYAKVSVDSMWDRIWNDVMGDLTMHLEAVEQ